MELLGKTSLKQLNIFGWKKGKRKVQGVSQSQAAALPRHQEEKEAKRGNRNAKRTEKHKTIQNITQKNTRQDFKTNRLAEYTIKQKSKTNTGTTALERSVE